MSELAFRQRLLEALELKMADFRDIEGEASADLIVRRAMAVQKNVQRGYESARLWEVRFAALAEVAGEDAAREAMEATPTDEKMKLLRALDPASANFMGTGLSLQEMLMSHRIQEYSRSFIAQGRPERDRRLDLIMRLSVEYKHVCSEDIQGTGRLERAVQDIILGVQAEDFNESIEWMCDEEMSQPVGLEHMPKEQQDAVKQQKEHRRTLWAPAIRICREYTDVFRAPPQELPTYDDGSAMLSAESGFVPLPRDPGLWVLETDLAIWNERGHVWSLPCLRTCLVQSLFDAGARWHGPDEDRNGYWHMADGEQFPEDEEYGGNRYHRIFVEDVLVRWLGRQEEQ